MRNANIGLALAAGGARGAYQAGALLALAEHRDPLRRRGWDQYWGNQWGILRHKVTASPGHMAQLVELWHAVPGAGIVRLDGKAVAAALLSMAARQTPAFLAWVQRLTGKFSILDPGPIASMLDCWLNYDVIRHSPTELSIAVLPETDPLLDVLSGPWRQARYLCAHDLLAPDLRSALLAAAAIPLAFPSQQVDGVCYADAALADPLPAQVLHRRGADRIVSIFLADDPVQNRLDFPYCPLLQVRPSVDIYTGYLSTFDFSSHRVDELIELGYRDGRTTCGSVRDILERLWVLRSQGIANEALAEALPEWSGLPAESVRDRNAPNLTGEE